MNDLVINTEDRERQLVEKFKQAKESYEAIKSDCEKRIADAKKTLTEVELELIELLDDQGKKSSATFDGLGKVTAVKPMVIASILPGQEPVALEKIRELGREDMIKETIHWQTLSIFVRQLLEENQPLPDGITYYEKRWLNFYPTK